MTNIMTDAQHRLDQTFLEALANDPDEIGRAWESIKEVMRPARGYGDQGAIYSCGQRQNTDCAIESGPWRGCE